VWTRKTLQSSPELLGGESDRAEELVLLRDCWKRSSVVSQSCVEGWIGFSRVTNKRINAKAPRLAVLKPFRDKKKQFRRAVSHSPAL